MGVLNGTHSSWVYQMEHTACGCIRWNTQLMGVSDGTHSSWVYQMGHTAHGCIKWDTHLVGGVCR